MVLRMNQNDGALLKDTELRKLISFLKINKTASSVDITLLGIRNIESTIERARKYGYKIKKKSTGILWNKEETLCLKRQK